MSTKKQPTAKTPTLTSSKLLIRTKIQTLNTQNPKNWSKCTLLIKSTRKKSQIRSYTTLESLPIVSFHFYSVGSQMEYERVVGRRWQASRSDSNSDCDSDRMIGSMCAQQHKHTHIVRQLNSISAIYFWVRDLNCEKLWWRQHIHLLSVTF